MSEEEEYPEEAPWACPWCQDSQTYTFSKTPDGWIMVCETCERKILIRDVTKLAEIIIKMKEKQVE